MPKISVHGGPSIEGQQDPVTVGWASADDWDLFDVVVVSASDNTVDLTASGGVGSVTGAGGNGNDRRFLQLRDFHAHDAEVRADLRITAGSPGTGQTGIYVRRGTAAPLCWTNVIFGANGIGLFGAWEFDGVSLTTNQQTAQALLYGADIATIEANGTTATVTTTIPHLVTAGEIVHFDASVGGFGQVTVASVVDSTTFTFATATTGSFEGGRYRWVLSAGWRTMAVRIQDRTLTAKQWRKPHPEPAWDDPIRAGSQVYPADLAGPGAGRVGVVAAHLGAGGQIDIDNLTATSLDPQPEQGSWYGLADIVNEARALADDARNRTPVACPIDGEPLQSGPRGELFCPWGNFTYDGGPAEPVD